MHARDQMTVESKSKCFVAISSSERRNRRAVSGQTGKTCLEPQAEFAAYIKVRAPQSLNLFPFHCDAGALRGTIPPLAIIMGRPLA